jgi:hypothetical protein
MDMSHLDKHLDIVTTLFECYFLYFEGISVTEHVVTELMCASTLVVQKSMFKMTMKSNAKVALVLPS